MIIELLGPQHIQIYRDLRLKALREVPTAFATSHAEEAARPLGDFLAKLRPNGDPVSGIFGAFDPGDTLVGMLGFAREVRAKRAHIGSLSGMFVVPGRRRGGVARSLANAAIKHARRLAAIRQVFLTVTEGNIAAHDLYLSLGFVPFGLEPDALLVEGTFYDQVHMALKLEADA